MAHVFKVAITTATRREVQVLAESAEEATAKVQPTLTEGEGVAEVVDQGELLA